MQLTLRYMTKQHDLLLKLLNNENGDEKSYSHILEAPSLVCDSLAVGIMSDTNCIEQLGSMGIESRALIPLQ